MGDDAFEQAHQEGTAQSTEDGPTGRRSGDEALGVLYQEYERVAEHFTRQFEYILRVAGIGFSAAAALLYLVTSKDLQNHEWVYWVAPLGLSMLYSILIDLFYQMTFLSYYIRDLEDDVAKRTKIQYFHFHNSGVRGVTSFRGGHPPRLANYVLILSFGIGIYLSLIIACFLGLRIATEAPIWRQAMFLFVQVTLGLILAWSAWGTTASLREKYDKWKLVSVKDSDSGFHNG